MEWWKKLERQDEFETGECHLPWRACSLPTFQAGGCRHCPGGGTNGPCTPLHKVLSKWVLRLPVGRQFTLGSLPPEPSISQCCFSSTKVRCRKVTHRLDYTQITVLTLIKPQFQSIACRRDLPGSGLVCVVVCLTQDSLFLFAGTDLRLNRGVHNEMDLLTSP